MELIVCLGNIGKEYAHNRHNVGFMVGDVIIKEFGFVKKGKKFKSVIYEGKIGRKKALLIKPQTFMNLSGEAVQLVQAFYKIPKKKTLVIYDDIDIAFGTVRFREKGSAGTHNGMRSIISSINSTDFPRIRIGIGPVPEKWDLTDFVLSNFSQEEEKLFPEIFNKSLDLLRPK